MYLLWEKLQRKTAEAPKEDWPCSQTLDSGTLGASGKLRPIEAQRQETAQSETFVCEVAPFLHN